MIDVDIIDYKLKELINVCKKTQNYKKLAVACFILLSNLMNEIGLRLGIRPRNKNSDENIYEYMMKINTNSKNNFKIEFFNLDLIKVCKRIELLFLRSKGNLDLQQISEGFNIYYELRKIKVPNLNNKIQFQNIEGLNTLSKSRLGMTSRTKNQSNNQIQNLILYKIAKKEQNLRNQLRRKYDPELFENVIALQQSIKSLDKKKDNKIKIHGNLKENLVYKESRYRIIGFFLLGIFLALLSFGISMTYEAMEYPIIVEEIGSFILIIYGFSLLIFFIYWNFFLKEGKS